MCSPDRNYVKSIHSRNIKTLNKYGEIPQSPYHQVIINNIWLIHVLFTWRRCQTRFILFNLQLETPLWTFPTFCTHRFIYHDEFASHRWRIFLSLEKSFDYFLQLFFSRRLRALVQPILNGSSWFFFDFFFARHLSSGILPFDMCSQEPKYIKIDSFK